MSWLRVPDAEPIPGYRLVSPLGSGGFGEVWKCEAPGGIYKAIKFVYGNLNDIDGDARAEQEFRALEKVKEIRYPFVCTIERIDIVDGELAIVMELADKNLYDRLVEAQAAGNSGIPREELLNYMRDAADGLDHLNDKYNLQHLDVKPRNLFLIAGRVKVADFGLVKHLERQSMSGMLGGVSPFYAAPETFSSRITKQSDQYSLAIVYMELLTGQRPFRGKNLRQLAIQHMSEPPDLEALPEHDRPIIARALSKDPAQRYPNCMALVRALALATPGLVEEVRESVAAWGEWGRGSRASFSDFLFDAVSTSSSAAELTVPTPNIPSVPKPSVSKPAVPQASVPQLSLPSIGDDDDEGKVSLFDEGERLDKTLRQQHIGVLRPSLLIGVGHFGRRALLELRCRLLDRLGDLTLMPVFRFLYLDSDSEGISSATQGAADVVLQQEQLFALPLQPVANYRRRILEHLTEWLPREKLYAMPRSLQPMHQRALGRLAFHDHYLRFISRIKREVQVATHPESIAQSMGHTGLSLRDNTPQVIVFADTESGLSGCLIDLAYAVRQVLEQTNHLSSPLVAVLHAGAPQDPATPREDLANTYATLTEVHHFSDPAVSFSAQYGGPDGPKVHSTAPPFHTVYLTQAENRSSDALHDCLARLSTFFTQELTTTLGHWLDQRRRECRAPQQLPFRSLGTYALWFPRGLLLRAAARQACASLLADWQNAGTSAVRASVEETCQRAMLLDPRLKPETLGPALEQASRTEEGSVSEQLQKLLQRLEEEIPTVSTREAAIPWARRTMRDVVEWTGTKPHTEGDSNYRRSRLSRLLEQAVVRVTEEWFHHLLQLALSYLDRSGARLACAEAALQRLVRASMELLQPLAPRANELAVRCKQAAVDLNHAFDACMSGGSSFFPLGGRMTRALRQFFDQLVHFAQQRLLEDLHDAQMQVFRRLAAKFEESIRDLAFCRHRLTHLQQLLALPLDQMVMQTQAFAANERTPLPLSNDGASLLLTQAMRATNTLQVIFPEGESDLEQAASRVISQMQATHWNRLEEILQTLVLTPLGGLFHICQKTSDLLRGFGSPMLDQAAAYLAELLPTTDVAQVEFSAMQSLRVDLSAQMQQHYDLAQPLLAGGEKEQQAYLLVPSSEAGRALADLVQRLIRGLTVVTLEGFTTDLVFCREQGFLRPADLAKIFRAAQSAYAELVGHPTHSPHARFDVLEWLPLET